MTDLSVLVTWSARRRALTRRFGVLTFHGTSITMSDRDGSLLIDAAGTEVSAAQIGRTMIELVGPDGVSRFVVGPHAQLANQKSARALIEAHGALVAPPRLPTQSEKVYRRITSSGSGYDRGSRALIQHIAWQPVLLQLIWETHARPIARGH